MLFRSGGAAAGLQHQRGRACPTGEGDHQHRGAERWGGVGLGLHQGLLEQKAIADGAGTAAMAAPISATGPAMQQQMNSPPARALEQGGGDALLGLGACRT